MQLESISGQEENNYTADALETVKLKFVSSPQQIETSEAFSPEYAHQHFGETEKIVGYKNLDVTVLYTDSTLFLTALVNYTDKLSGNSAVQCDDIPAKIKDALPSNQLDAFLAFDKFKIKLEEQNKFRPYGNLVAKFEIEREIGKVRCFELYKFDQSDDETDPRLEEGIKYLERAQSIAFWYIDAVTYTDEEDPRFFNYFLFESFPSTEDGGSSPRYKFAGYATLYRFYHYPDKERVRISHMLLAPPFRKMGLGQRFLQAIYSDILTVPSIWDITAETPADSFVLMRDYADSLNCVKLKEFSSEKLKSGFTEEMYNSAREKLKLNKTQTRRVYEILRLFHTKINVSAERESFKEDVLKRLKKLVMDPKKDSGRLFKTLAGDEKSLAFAMKSVDPEQQSHQLETLYENLINNYRSVLDLLVKYEKEFVP